MHRRICQIEIPEGDVRRLGKIWAWRKVGRLSPASQALTASGLTFNFLARSSTSNPRLLTRLASAWPKSRDGESQMPQPSCYSSSSKSSKSSAGGKTRWWNSSRVGQLYGSYIPTVPNRKHRRHFLPSINTGLSPPSSPHSRLTGVCMD